MKSSKILLVEDQLLIAMDAEAILNDHGYINVKTATNLEDARSIALDFRPQVAILDINIGGCTSFEFAKELEDSSVKIAFASGYAKDAENYQGVGNVPVISKPYSTDDLVGTIQSLLS